VVEALGLCDAEGAAAVEDGAGPEIEGYGEPMPWEGINRDDDAGVRPYVGTSFNTRSSGTVDPFDNCG